MRKVAVLLADGFEEGEALFVVDVLRRAAFTCHMVGVDSGAQVTGSHGISVIPDALLSEDMTAYDMLVLPGGLPGAENLSRHPKVLDAVRDCLSDPARFVGAICAAPMVLAAADVARGRRLTSYPSDRFRALFPQSEYVEAPVVVDGNLITSRGPATTLPFAYALVDALGGDSAPLREGMLFNLLVRHARENPDAAI